MLDLGLGKMAVIGTVALVVIGPKDLPRVARMAGTLLGRARRYLDALKAEAGAEQFVALAADARRAFDAEPAPSAAFIDAAPAKARAFRRHRQALRSAPGQSRPPRAPRRPA